MKCEKNKKNISFFARDELPARKARRLRKHLEKCEACRKELSEYEAVLTSLRAVAQEEDKDWEESEWKSLMKKVIEETPNPPAAPLRLAPKRAWAYGFLLLLVLGLAGLIFRHSFKKPAPSFLTRENVTVTETETYRRLKLEEATDSERARDVPFSVRLKTQQTGQTLAEAQLKNKDSQDLLAMTLVSKETGLKIYWYFDKNFEWKEAER